MWPLLSHSGKRNKKEKKRNKILMFSTLLKKTNSHLICRDFSSVEKKKKFLCLIVRFNFIVHPKINAKSGHNNH